MAVALSLWLVAASSGSGRGGSIAVSVGSGDTSYGGSVIVSGGVSGDVSGVSILVSRIWDQQIQRFHSSAHYERRHQWSERPHDFPGLVLAVEVL